MEGGKRERKTEGKEREGGKGEYDRRRKREKERNAVRTWGREHERGC